MHIIHIHKDQSSSHCERVKGRKGKSIRIELGEQSTVSPHASWEDVETI